MIDLATLGLDPGMLPGSPRLQRHFPLEALRAPYVEHLEDRLRRDPQDLRAHVERVMQRIALGDAGHCHAALVDLFAALGGSGRELRARLLGSASHLLEPAQRAALQSRLDPAPAGGEDARGAPPPTVQQLAAQARARGDVDSARVLLEEALHADPADGSCCEALLDLYLRHGQRAHFERMRARLLGRRVALPALWEAAAAQLAPAAAGGAGG